MSAMDDVINHRNLIVNNLPINLGNVVSPGDKNNKIKASLIEHVYSQLIAGLIGSLFCACVVFVGLYKSTGNNNRLFIWSVFFLVATLYRVLLNYIFNLKHERININSWKNLYILGNLLAGLSWGLMGVMFFPYATPLQQTLLILMLAGISSSAVLLSAAIPKSVIMFLVSSVLIFIISIIFFKSREYYLFDIALSLYFIFTIFITYKTYFVIKNSIILKFENDELLFDLKIANKILKNTSTHDPLTNIANRRLFYVNLKDSITRAKNKKSLVAIFYIDLDKFKIVNDTYGHDAGDFILKNVIYKLRTFFRKNDILARLGGDEFVIIIEDAKSKDELKSIAIKICQLIATPVVMNNISMHVTASIGISIYPEDGKNADEIVTISDQRMLFSKKQGGNTFSFESGPSI